MLNITAKYPKAWDFHSLQSIHYVLEAMRFVYTDRNRYLGDPNFVHNPIEYLLSDEHANAIRAKIKPFSANFRVSQVLMFLIMKNQKQRIIQLSINMGKTQCRSRILSMVSLVRR